MLRRTTLEEHTLIQTPIIHPIRLMRVKAKDQRWVFALNPLCQIRGGLSTLPRSAAFQSGRTVRDNGILLIVLSFGNDEVHGDHLYVSISELF